MAAHQPEGWPTVIPRLVTDEVEGLVGFLQLVFDGQGEARGNAPSEIHIGDSMVMVSGGPERARQTAFLYVYVDDADAAYERAIANGARPMEPPGDMPYGDRRAMVVDPWGNTWQIATHGGAFK